MTEFLDPDHEVLGDEAGNLIDPDTDPKADAIPITAASSAHKSEATGSTGPDGHADGDPDGSAG